MAAPTARTLVIADGDIPSLVACASVGEGRGPASRHGREERTDPIVRELADSARRRQPRPDRPLVWCPRMDANSAAARERAVRRAADVYELEVVEGRAEGREDPTVAPGTELLDLVALARVLGRGAATSAMLLQAAHLAMSLGAGIVVWPTCGGAEVTVDRVASAVDRALLAQRLAWVDSAEHGAASAALEGIEIHTPYADLDDRQVADLVIDLDVPPALAWWWTSEESEARASRGRWSGALEAVGWRASPAADPSAHGGTLA